MADRLRDRLPKDEPYREIDGFVTAQRTRAELDSIFEFSETNLERKDIEVNRTRNGAVVDKTKSLTDEEFDTYRERASRSEKLQFSGQRKNYRVKPAALDTPSPLKVHTSRDRDTMNTDSERKARVTTDPEQYARAPESYDFPFLDTPDSFEEVASDVDPGGWLSRKAGADDLFRF